MSCASSYYRSHTFFSQAPLTPTFVSRWLLISADVSLVHSIIFSQAHSFKEQKGEAAVMRTRCAVKILRSRVKQGIRSSSSRAASLHKLPLIKSAPIFMLIMCQTRQNTDTTAGKNTAQTAAHHCARLSLCVCVCVCVRASAEFLLFLMIRSLSLSSSFPFCRLHLLTLLLASFSL